MPLRFLLTRTGAEHHPQIIRFHRSDTGERKLRKCWVMHIDPGDFTPEALNAIAPRCPACESGEVTLVGIDRIYPHRQDLCQRDDGSTPYYWLCGCGAYCGAHRDTLKPFGTPADAETRRARQDAHAAFDPLWRRKMAKEGISRTKARGKGYKWLAAQLSMDPKLCHIGEMSAVDARRVVDVCRNWKGTPA